MSKEEIEPDAVFMLTMLKIAKNFKRSQNNKKENECKTKLKIKKRKWI